MLWPIGGRFQATPQVLAGAAVPIGRLQTCGRSLCRSDGSLFQWRGVTAFGLADLVADGREADARAFVTWASGARFTVLRVLAMNRGGMDLSPTEGRRALPATLALAREYGMYVQVVALAGTGTNTFDNQTFLQEQVREVARLCAAADNCVLELANEPYHPSQAALNDPARMRQLQREVPPGLPVAWGAAPDYRSADMAGGSYVVAHVSRSGDRWTRLGRAQALADLSRRTDKFVVDNEPIGAAESAEPGRRDDQPGAFFVQGLLARMIGVGSAFHCADCLAASVPGPVQRACANAFVAGATLVSPATSLAMVNDRDLNAQLAQLGPTGPKARSFTAVGPAEGVLLLVGASGSPQPSWRPGWQMVQRVSEWPGVHAWRVVRVR